MMPSSMLRYLQSLSAFLFYLLGGSFFLAYLLLRNNILSRWDAAWLQTADLPLAFVCLLYGGLSLYISVQGRSEKPSLALPFLIGLPLFLLFCFLVTMNFWGAW